MASTMMTVKMSAGLEKALKGFGEEMAVNVVGLLADKYGFNVDEAVEHLALDALILKKRGAKGAKKGASKGKRGASKGKKSDDDSASISSRGSAKVKHEKPSVPLPFVGTVNENFCMGIRPTYGLYSQCTNAKLSDSCDYCKTCQSQVDKGATGKPKCGDIRDRMESSVNMLEWIAPDGKQVLPFQNVVEKRGIDLDTAKAEMVKFFGVEMPDEQLVKREKKRGRKPGRTVVKKEGGLLDAVRERLTNSGSGDVSDTDGMSVDDVDDVESVKGDMLAALAKSKPITEAKPKAAKRVSKKKVVKEVVATPEPEMVEAPKEEVVEAPKEEVVEAPKEEVVEAPKEEVVDALAIKVPEVVDDDDSGSDSDEDDDGIEANFTYDGKEYYKDEDDNIFSMEDGDHVGVWDEDDKVVEWV